MFLKSLIADQVSLRHFNGNTSAGGSTLLINYRFITSIRPVSRAIVNSIIVSGGATLSTIFFGSMTGYALVKLKFTGRLVLLSLVLISVMFPVYINMVPLFLITKKLGLINTLFAAMIPHLIYGLGVFLFRQFYMTFPDELLDAARVDGYGELKLWLSIVFPLSGATAGAVGIITFFKVYEDVVWPLIVIKKDDFMTASQLISLFQSGTYNMNVGITTALGSLCTLPIIILFLFLQKSFVRSIALAGIKG